MYALVLNTHTVRISCLHKIDDIGCVICTFLHSLIGFRYVFGCTGFKQKHPDICFSHFQGAELSPFYYANC